MEGFVKEECLESERVMDGESGDDAGDEVTCERGESERER